MIAEGYIRKDAGVVNTDLSAFRSAKARIEQTKTIQSLEARLNTLEEVVQSLQQTCKEITNE
jgi:prefoldin subunit 5|tara:strand:- start:509 stop:694 length:186 start_codon:yes stop_codon:yes gene_type:complete